MKLNYFLKGIPQIAFGQAEQIRVSNTPHVGRASIARFVAGDVEDADFTKDAAGAQSNEDGLAIIGHDAQFAPLDDVHLLADVALAADVIARTENLQLELENQLGQETRLAILEQFDLLQCVQMNMDGDLSFQLVG